MDSQPHKRGRPPHPTQTLPLFLHQVRSRVKMQAVVSAPIDAEMRCYVDWAHELTMMAVDEIRMRVVDQALEEYFKRDKLWRPIRVQRRAEHDARQREAILRPPPVPDRG